MVSNRLGFAQAGETTLLKEINEELSTINGRLGPRMTELDKRFTNGTIAFHRANEIESESNFASVRANTCIYDGKFMYEVTLGSPGIQQIGWTTPDAKFTNEVLFQIQLSTY